jgi:Intracellular proteinase inhibitor
MQLTLHTDRESYRPGDPVQLRLEVLNDTAEPVTLLFNSSQKYEFEVLWEDQLLWRWSADRVFAQMLTKETIAPGQGIQYEAAWDGRRSDGELARPGEYNARGVLTTSSRSDPMVEQAFTIAG